MMFLAFVALIVGLVGIAYAAMAFEVIVEICYYIFVAIRWPLRWTYRRLKSIPPYLRDRAELRRADAAFKNALLMKERNYKMLVVMDAVGDIEAIYRHRAQHDPYTYSFFNFQKHMDKMYERTMRAAKETTHA